MNLGLSFQVLGFLGRLVPSLRVGAPGSGPVIIGEGGVTLECQEFVRKTWASIICRGPSFLLWKKNLAANFLNAVTAGVGGSLSAGRLSVKWAGCQARWARCPPGASNLFNQSPKAASFLELGDLAQREPQPKKMFKKVMGLTQNS